VIENGRVVEPDAATGLGSLEVGKAADIVLLSPRLAVRRVFIAGVEFDRRG
jgi:hypothetical protein